MRIISKCRTTIVGKTALNKCLIRDFHRPNSHKKTTWSGLPPLTGANARKACKQRGSEHPSWSFPAIFNENTKSATFVWLRLKKLITLPLQHPSARLDSPKRPCMQEVCMHDQRQLH